MVGNLCDRAVVSSASDRRVSNFESCVWRAVSSHSSQHPQEVLPAQFSPYVHKGGPNLIHFISFSELDGFGKLKAIYLCIFNLFVCPGLQNIRE